MIKKIVLIFACIAFQVSVCSAATQVKVIALDSFRTDNPSKKMDVKIADASNLGKYNIEVGSVLHCKVLKVVEPKRGKRNAGFYVQPTSYTTDGETFDVKQEIYGKYSKFVLSKEELKKIPSFKNMKKAALMVGNHFVQGFSLAYSFVEGIVQNEEENRLKSGVVKAYEESPLSYMNEGEHIYLQKGDDFYLVFKADSDKEDYKSEENDD